MADKKDNIFNFYFQARWQTALTTLYLIMVVYLILFYVGNLWTALKFAYYTLVSSVEMMGLEFALWGVIFEIAILVPFLASWYAVFLLPKVWQSGYSRMQKIFLTIVLIATIPLIITIGDTVARYALETDVLREFVGFYNILPE